ncbi:MAG: HNH endonuclease [Clostridia bacterium]|nr:HNH endonuclease [Clostridia bacterium]
MRSAEEFYNSYAWRCKRAAILRRDGFLCQWCRRYNRRDADGLPVRATLVHHIREVEDAPELALADANLVSLCDACHNRAHPERSARRRRSPPGSRK